MKHKRAIIAVACVAGLTVLVWRLVTGSDEPKWIIPPGPYLGMKDPRWPIYMREVKRDSSLEWKTPISFYGKVVDQDEQAVPDVEVHMDWTDLTRKGTSDAVRVTDAGGLFSVTGASGKHFSVISLTKWGYVAAKASNQSSFEYAGFWEPTYHIPDPNNPVIFHLRKKAAAELMVHRGPKLFAAPNDGVPAVFDLTRGKKTTIESGDLFVRITKGPKANHRFDWTATVEGVNGAGLIESHDEFMVVAPTEGYQPRWSVTHTAAEEKFESEVQTKLFVRTGQGKYARLELSIIPEYNESAAVDFEVFLNPSGSPNLEFDPGKLSEVGSR
ncbi:MAG: hypothetical protein QOE70_2645 [Chthoniobacter sp.]|jgi:hypothetical protein|nr:hypothetical protein [Chthoniobacter sp.]